MKYANKKAVIIGGTSGMGMGIVNELVKDGAQVLITARNEKLIQETQEQLGEKGVALRSDATSTADRQALAQTVKDKFGTFDYLFINVGICEVESFDKVTEASYDRQFNVNTKGAFFTVQQLSPLMNDGGSITFTSSVADKMGIPGMLVYSATKAALVSMAQVLAAELMPRKIRANALSVGYADTPSMGVGGFSEAEKQAFKDGGNKYTPMGRIASPEEFGKAAVFLAAEAEFVTGVNLPFDGGIGLGVFAQQS
ncbi:MAG TPA: SDR family oxidoreductase [Verrucomicrobiae bacterium]|nr:SDR family oxidoreductase [Verrucomicrobiae bacterium]